MVIVSFLSLSRFLYCKTSWIQQQQQLIYSIYFPGHFNSPHFDNPFPQLTETKKSANTTEIIAINGKKTQALAIMIYHCQNIKNGVEKMK